MSIENAADLENGPLIEGTATVVAEAEPTSAREVMRRAVDAQRESADPEAREGRSPVNAGDSRERGADGRFLVQDAQAARQTGNSGQQPAQGQQQPNAQADPQAQEAPGAPKPPGSWSPAAKAAFGTLAPDVQAAVVKREQEVERGFQILQNYRGLEQFQPYMDQAGISHAEVMRRAIEWERMTIQDPIGTVRHLLQLRGVDPRMAAQALMTGQPGPRVQQPAPQERPVDIRGEVQRVIAEREINSTVDKFLADPANTHAELVADHMAALIQGGQAPDLQTAYQMAIWANPEIRATLIRQGQAQAPANGARAAQAATQARSAARAVTGAPARGATPNGARQEPKSAREAMRMAVDAQIGR